MPIDYPRALALKTTGRRFRYGTRGTILYALGLGFGSNPDDPRELRFVYEKDLLAVPTMATIVAWGADTLAETGVDFARLVQGEQRLTVHGPLPPAGEVVADWQVKDIVDKGAGRGALIIHEFEIRDAASGAPLATVGRTSFARGDGGFGGPATGGPTPHPIPDRPPDRSCQVSIAGNQALIYRLSGDDNPLHADPEVARRAGFPGPILHGLATYGVGCRAVLQTWADLDPGRLRAFDVRFSAPVFPGDDILFRMWRDDDTISFEAHVPARDSVVLRNGRAVLA
jgi:acyl dehydratase